MEKLIITVAGNSRTSYPHNNFCPTQEDIPGVHAAVRRCGEGRRRDRAHPRTAHAGRIDPGRRQDGLEDPSRRLEEAARHDHEQGRSDHAVRRGVGAHRGEDRADEARPRHDGGRLQRPRRIFPAGADLAAEADDGDPSGRGADRLCQGRRGAQGQARMRVLPDRRVLASRFRAQGRLPEEADLRDAVHRLAGRHLDAADRARAAVLRRQPAAGRASGTSA